jgi:DNA-binding transcriptional ArsR family regulator
MDFFEEQAALYKALSHPTRLAILEILREGEECVCHMEAALGLRQAYISQQLMVLRDIGLVENRRDGWNNFYYVVKPEIYAVLDDAAGVYGKSRTAKDKPFRLMHKPADCSCPKCTSG